MGWRITTRVTLNSIAVFPPGIEGAGSLGHVAWVTDVGASSYTVHEMNGANGPYTWDYRVIPFDSEPVVFILT